MAIHKIKGTATLGNGATVEFESDSEGTIRWGASREALGEAVDVTDGIAALISQYGDTDKNEAHPDDCAACAAGEPSVHAYEHPTVPTPEEVAARTLADHAIKPHWVRNGVQVSALIAEAVAADRASR